MRSLQSCRFLNGTHLKLLALLTMTIDHVGLLLLDNARPLRIIGRIAFPIFAFMIAEGCRYTKNRLRYFGVIFALGLLCQVVYLVVDHSYYLNILITLSLSILIIYSIQFAKERRTLPAAFLPLVVILLLFVLDRTLAYLLQNTNYAIDYTFAGVLLPVFISLADRYEAKLCFAGAGMLLVVWAMNNSIQIYSLLALIPLFFYNGKPGKHRLKWLFYLYYPLHLVTLYALALVI